MRTFLGHDGQLVKSLSSCWWLREVAMLYALRNFERCSGWRRKVGPGIILTEQPTDNIAGEG